MASCTSAGSSSDKPGWSGDPLLTAAELEQRAKTLVESVNAKRMRDQQQLQELRDGLQVLHERAVKRLEAAWYGQMQANSEAVRRQVEALYDVIGQVASHEAEVQQARDELNKLIAEMAGHRDADRQ